MAVRTASSRIDVRRRARPVGSYLEGSDMITANSKLQGIPGSFEAAKDVSVCANMVLSVGSY